LPGGPHEGGEEAVGPDEVGELSAGGECGADVAMPAEGGGSDLAFSGDDRGTGRTEDEVEGATA
jgi:hypothetical protein